ncbi:histidine phosphatase family protein [Corynebacterium pseudotuberculosis]|uniref:Histidine phosphatase family protein n=1 Tax=Corynebacterium pseudotuberculosis (strain C231) TaxID=681645 RepID=D9QE57_CORP2|nr:histidine phosphatase family protein [Corynebacterium pseudotuberculosis]ADK28073.1 histidine phosphatase family protein [Corynebacterium pseudotuberculosis FRC41]ADL09780.1 histidine phosphatase family protein [Corynebacterium pseudotuberculosis C231]ADL20186.1 histidine phosphatase family protein [Corynebacterium pseudotuberculosis 1002]ADO25575.1 histidine phosphatase family protein [Corynebacterium pseudotuberculosis I19]AEK91623.1 Phosphoglycerate mutase [Corynebacterium pseudotubercul
MSTTIVHLIRHGEVFNPERILYGRIPDYHLSSRGHSMAARTASSFAGHDVSVLMSSPLERAQETAAPFAEKLGLEVRLDDRLLESGNRFEGLRVKGLRSQLWNPVRWPLMANPLLPSWGEHYVDQRDRMMAVVEDARRAAEGHEAILVSHQLPIVCVQRHVQGKPLAHNPAARQCNLASVSSLVFEGDQLVDYIYTEPAQEI